MAATFVGRSGHHVLFENGENAVIIDSRVPVVASTGSSETLRTLMQWASGDFSEADEAAAELALSSLNASPAPTGRMYTIPKGVQLSAKRALAAAQNHQIFSTSDPSSLATASLLASGGQIDFNRLVNVANYFERHSEDENRGALLPTEHGPSIERIVWDMHGGDSGKKWASNIAERERSNESEKTESVSDLGYLLDEDAGPEFIVRISEETGDIDRLYRIDLDNRTYVWSGGSWDDLGNTDWSIWDYDRELDRGQSPEFVTHILIDPESAIYVAANLHFGPVSVEDINALEAQLVRESAPDLDWELLDSTLTAAGGTPGDGIYTPEERSENASTQVRDSNGRFAKQGSRVIVGGNPQATGTISRVNPENGTVDVTLDSGGSQTVLGRQVESVPKTSVVAPSSSPTNSARVDFSGILAQPRTPVNRVQGTIAEALPTMTAGDIHSILNNYPAWVKSQRDSLKDSDQVRKHPARNDSSSVYDHPLLNEWMNKKNRRSSSAGGKWTDALLAAVDPPEQGEPVSPETSDVQPLYMAVVSPDDPRAVFSLISLVPSSTTTLSPTVYMRQDGKWVRDEQTLVDLKSATPPPVVPLDSDTLNEVLVQVDEAQGVGNADQDASAEDERVLNSPLPEDADLPPGAPKPEEVVLASGDFALSVLWGPRKDFMDAAITAAGGADRNRGGAEKLRRYWTIGPGGAKIAWGTPGDWTRCVRNLTKYLGPRARGYCSLRHKEMTGMWTGDQAHRQMFSLNAATGAVYSTELVEPEDTILKASVLRAQRDVAKKRIDGGLVASASVDVRDVVYPSAEEAVEAVTAAAGAYSSDEVGGAFWIPIALPEGVESGDSRIIEPGATEIRGLPIPLLWQFRTAQGHDGSVVVGKIERLHRVPGGVGAGYGHFDVGPWGREAERMVRNGMFRFVSADMDKFSAKTKKDAPPSDEAAEDDENTIEAKETRVNKARVMAVTIVAKPAFQEATIQIVPDAPILEETVFPDGLFMEEPDPIDAPALIAAGYIAESIPVVPPASWFTHPRLDGPTPLTVTDDGRVFGHIAAWSTGHINPQLGGINPPRSKSGYKYFNTGVLRTDDGADVTVGQLTLAGGHAGLEASAREAVKHYDDTGSAVADVHAGEDDYGIWVAGSLRPGVTAEQVRAFRASAPSGDWRPIRGSLELVAVCQVNVPGFPIARAFVAGGQMTALVAAGSAQLLKLRQDPLEDLQERIKSLETFAQRDLAQQAESAVERVKPVLEERNARLQAKAEAVFATMENFGYVSNKVREKAAQSGEALKDGSYPIRNVTDLKNAIRAYGRSKESDRAEVRRHIIKRAKALGKTELLPEKWNVSSITASVEFMRSKTAEFAAKIEVDPEGKYKPGHQPRDYRGRFRDVLARLKNDLGANETDDIAQKINQTAGRVEAGDYAAAVKGALDLKDTLDALNDGILDPTDIRNVRRTAADLGTVIANLPLPFDNQAAKIRFTDLPPALRDLIDDFIARVEDKLESPEDAADAVAPLKAFKSGSDVFSQGEVSKEMSKLLRLLT